MDLFNNLKNKYLELLKPVQQTLGNVGQQAQNFQQTVNKPIIQPVQKWSMPTVQPQVNQAQDFYQQQLQPKLQQFTQQAPKLVQNVGRQLQRVPDYNFPSPKIFGQPILNTQFVNPASEIARSTGRTIERIGQRKFLQGTTGEKIEDIGNIAQVLPMGRIASKPLAFSKEIQFLRNKLRPEDVQIIGKFAEIVETTGGKGNLGELGQTIHSLATNIFGKQAATWNNQKIKNVFDLVLQKIGTQSNQAGLGLSIKNIREGQGGIIGNMNRLKDEAKKFRNVEDFINKYKNTHDEDKLWKIWQQAIKPKTLEEDVLKYQGDVGGKKFGLQRFLNDYAPTVRESKLTNISGAVGKYNPVEKTIELAKGKMEDKWGYREVLGHESRHSIGDKLSSWLASEISDLKYKDIVQKVAKMPMTSGSNYSKKVFLEDNDELAQALLEKFTYENKLFKNVLPEVYDEISRYFNLRKQARSIGDLAIFYKKVTSRLPQPIRQAGLSDTVYAGRNGKYDVLKPDKSGVVYTTSNPEMAKGFGQNIHTISLKDKNILDATTPEGIKTLQQLPSTLKTDREIFQELKKMGYDGVKKPYEVAGVGTTTNETETLLFGDTRVAQPTIGEAVGVIGDIQSGFEKGRKARETAENIARGSLWQRLKSEGLDRLTPVFDFVNKAGKELPTEQNPYRRMRLLAGISGKVEAYITKNVMPILKSEKGRGNDLSALWTLERETELTGRGLVRKRTAEQIQQGINELKAKYGEEGFATLQKSSEQLRQVGNDLLNQLHEVGVIGDDSFNAIRQKNQFYAPMEAVEHIVDNLEKGAYGTGNSFNVASQNVIKKIGDYAGDVSDPIETLVRRIPKIIALVEKNKAMQSFVNLRNQFPEVYKDLIVPLKGDVTSQGMKTVNLFENGKNVSYAVPEVVANAIKGLDAETAGILVNLGTWQAKILRAGATGLNIGFIPVNIVRDFQDALTTELTEKGAKAMFQFLSSYPAAIFSAAKKGNLYQQWAAAGGLQSTMTEQLLKSTPKTVSQLSGKTSYFKAIIGSPKSLIEFANRVGEQSTRLARFKSGVSRGENVMEAAFKSRDISLDFAKAGNVVKMLNQVIPFLNAGIQGSEKVIRLYKNNPKAAIAVTGVLFGIPAVSLYTHNSQFKDFDDIPEAEKQRNWLLIARDRTQEEIAAGEKVIGIKIPKGFLARMTTNSIESAMDFMRKQDPQSFASSMLGIVEGFSPVGLPYDKESSGRSVSQVIPPAARAVLEGLSNTNFYFGSSIVPQGLQRLPASEQYREKTPAVYKAAGAVAGISPLILENTVNTTTGGLGRQFANFFSGDIKGGTVDQVTRRFSGIQGGKQADIAYETVEKEKQYTALRNKRLREAYESGNEAEFNKLVEGMTTQQIKSVLNYAEDKEANKQLTPEQRAYETLTNEEKLRLEEKRPDLTSKVNLIDTASAATQTKSKFLQDIQTNRREAAIKAKVGMSGKPQTYNGKYYYINENGNVASVELDASIYQPKISGFSEIDKLELQKQAASYTAKIKDIQTLYDLNQLTANEANNRIAKLKQEQKNIKTKYGGSKKPKKVSFKGIKAIKLKLPKAIKVKAIKAKKVKVYKMSKLKKVKKIKLT